MTKKEFHNALRILLNIDKHELVDAGIINRGDDFEWYEFRADPFRWFIKASDPTAEKLWELIQHRQSPRPF
ncbi:MAG: hypothetical protein IH831_02085 [Planctomycetes bacterium]|nr:hypothetical protein [Planctomycetota bacterium]